MNRRFYHYERFICKKMDFSTDVYRMLCNDIERVFGKYDKNINYAGRGDSREFHLSEKLVPELYDNFIYYFHDGLYCLIEKEPIIYKYWKDRADEIMKYMMEYEGAIIIDDIYWIFVKLFG